MIIDQAGAVAFRIVDGEPRVLLVRARQSPNEWIFPKGHIEPGETASDAARRELLEEAGVRGSIKGQAGHVEFKSADEGDSVKVQYYVVEYSEPPAGGEARPWVEHSLNDAMHALTHADSRRVLVEARAVIDRLR